MSQKFKLDESIWNDVQADLAEKTQSGYKMAVLDCDKILRFVSKKSGISGNIRDQLHLLGSDFKRRDDLKKAFQKVDEILNGFEYQLSSFEVEDYVLAYREAVKRLSYLTSPRLFSGVRKYLNRSFLKSFVFRKIILPLIFLVLIIKFLTKTNTGQEIAKKISDFNDYFFSILVFVFVLIIIVLIIVLGSFIILDKRKKINIKEEN